MVTTTLIMESVISFAFFLIIYSTSHLVFSKHDIVPPVKTSLKSFKTVSDIIFRLNFYFEYIYVDINHLLWLLGGVVAPYITIPVF